METVQQWYTKEVYRWRTGASITWSLATLPLLSSVYMFGVKFSFLHPIHSLVDIFSFSFSGKYVVYLLFLAAVYTLLSLYNSQLFSVHPDIPLTRLEMIVSHFRGRKLVHALAMSVGTSFMAWCCCGWIGDDYSSLSHYCFKNGDSLCLNERHLVFVLHGLHTGLLHHYSFYSQQKNYLQFRPVHQSKLFHVRNSFAAILLNSFWNTVSALKYFYLWYFFFGDVPKIWIVSSLKLKLRPTAPLNSLYGMLDLQLLLYLLLAGVFFRLLFNVSHLLYKLYNTAPYEFPIETSYALYKNKCLHDALTCSSSPLIQCLAYLDLKHVSEAVSSKRAQLFSLSQPGGHPHNWRRVFDACLTEINAFNDQLQQENWRQAATYSARQKNSHTNLDGCLPVEGPFGRFLQKLYENVRTKPILCYILSQLPDASCRRLFVSTQPLIMAIDALSNLACISYQEDKYGIVQRSLSVLLTSLLNLNENIERYFKLVPAANKRDRDQLSSHDSGLRYSLRHSTKTALYRIVHTFGKHFQDLELSEEQLKKLRFFQDYKV